MNELLNLKNKMKSKRPIFVRQDSKKELFKNRTKWRKPRGLHNKRRLGKKGHQKNPSIGYRSPKYVRGIHKTGLELILINNIKDIEKIKKEDQVALLSSKLGTRLKVKILEACLKKKINVFNVKDIEKYLKEVKESLEKRKKEKIKKEAKKKEAKTKAEKKAEEKAEKKEDSQEEIKEEVMESKQEMKQEKIKDTPKIDKSKSKAGHIASSVPGTRQ